jgi:hypothetical protein
MKSKLLTVALCLVGGLLLSNKTLAQTTVFDIGPDLQNGGLAGQGDWQVTVTETGVNAYSISVVATTPTPTAAAEEVTVSFLNPTPVDIQSIGGGATSPGVAWIPTTDISDDQAIWSTPNPLDASDFLFTNGTNTFTGSEVLDGPATEVTVRVYDDGHAGPWAGTDTLAPEASSLALLVPGLIPLGVILRKRRRQNSVSN